MKKNIKTAFLTVLFFISLSLFIYYFKYTQYLLMVCIALFVIVITFACIKEMID